MPRTNPEVASEADIPSIETSNEANENMKQKRSSTTEIISRLVIELQQLSSETSPNSWMRRLILIIGANHRNGRVPRGGWKVIASSFSLKFGIKTKQEVQSFYQQIKNQLGQPDRQPLRRTPSEEQIMSNIRGITIKNPKKI